MVTPLTGSDAGRSSTLIPFIGRRRELRHLVAALRRRESRLIFGPAGAGKTRLIQEALARTGEPHVWLSGAQVLHDLLADLAAQLALRLARYPDLGRAPSISLKGAILASLEAAPRPVILEDVSEVEPRTYRFLREIYYLAGCCLIVTATSPESLGHLRKLLWDPRQHVALGPLSGAEARRLFEEAARRFGLESLDLDDFRPKVLAAAQGNPGRILAMCRLAKRAEYHDGRRVKFLPLRIDALCSMV